ncbi:glutathione S-transferase family protein [Brevundimonas sp.]|uniref:glutathione S-transferase family protein n=1 Tax=Brevundimonas sp. TaxID=1871086 RepID=UPI002C0CB65D|nr:glutathione S-transferase family protein [Brevundimonas sp.]HWQ87038.1 glutathione S-transferase family protein [Brevundimonas sp.]
MITLHAFGRVHPFVHGETRDLRVQWALEEMGLPYAVRGWDHTGGETTGPGFSAISPFNQIPILTDGDVTLSESAAILIHLAEKSGKLIPADAAGRAHVIQWTLAALSTVEGPIQPLKLMDMGAMGEPGDVRAFLTGWTHRVLDGVNRQLEGRDWIAADDFTIADLLLASVLRQLRHTDLMDGYANVKAFYARAMARPAWKRTLDLYAERLGADRAAIE